MSNLALVSRFHHLLLLLFFDTPQGQTDMGPEEEE